jgi:hypothetical protein
MGRDNTARMKVMWDTAEGAAVTPERGYGGNVNYAGMVVGFKGKAGAERIMLLICGVMLSSGGNVSLP